MTRPPRIELPQTRLRREWRSRVARTLPTQDIVVTRLGVPVAVAVSTARFRELDALRARLARLLADEDG